jgi:hypothetical protein
LFNLDPIIIIRCGHCVHIHSLQDKENDRHVLGEAEIIKSIGDNLYLVEYNGVRCTAIFNYITNRYYLDDIYGVITEGQA